MGRLAKTNAAVAAEPRGESPPPVIRGTKMVSASLDRAFSRQLKSLSIDQGRPMAALLQEALNDLFVKYRAELLRKAFALVEIAEEAREQGNRLGIITKDHQVLAEVIAL